MFRKAKQITKRIGYTTENYNEIKKEPMVSIIKAKEEQKNDELEILLSMETQARVDALVEKENTPKRPTTIKFELPARPLRPNLSYPKAKPYRSLPEEGLIANERRKKRSSWRNLFREEEEIAYVTMDARVRLRMRPLPTFGYVKYIGAVGFGKGEWIGIELDHRVGNCDGSMNGVRYFITDHHRGIFCKRSDLEAIAG